MAKPMLLQRLLSLAQGWDTVVDFGPADAPLVQTAAAMLAKVGPVAWRVVATNEPDQVLAVFDGKRWQSVGESMPGPTDPPWSENGLHLASDWLERQREVSVAIQAQNPNAQR